VLGRRNAGRRSLRAESVTLAVAGLALLLAPVATVIFDYRFVVPALPLLGAGAVIGATSLFQSSRGRSTAGPLKVPTSTEPYATARDD
jgi:hypothetical protein